MKGRVVILWATLAELHSSCTQVADLDYFLAVMRSIVCNCCTELREMRQYVKNLGLTGRLAQTLVERHGKDTKARLEQDPYFCLHGLPGVTFRY